MRLFVALDLPQAVRTLLSEIMGGLPGASWLLEENLHLTLRFIGEVDNGLADDIDQALGQIYFEPFALSLAGIGTFGEKARLRLLWAGVAENPALVRLQARIEGTLRRAGLPEERRKFKPHVTLARFRSDPPSEKLGRFFQAHALLKSEPFQVENFSLYSSTLTPNGAFYRQEVTYPDAGLGRLSYAREVY